MSLYYEQDGIVIYHGDCREILPTLQPASVDLLVTDPPYGVQWLSNARRLSFNAIAGDDSTDAALAGVGLALRALQPYRHVYVFGRFDFTALPLQSVVELVWDKGDQSGGDVASPWGREHEYIQFGVYVPSIVNRGRGKGNLSARLRKGSVLRVPRIIGNACQWHPTEKPVRLLRELIESSSCLDETVLDPFCGVGSTLVAARVEGRSAVGIELEEKYCEIAAKRLAQGCLFTAREEAEAAFMSERDDKPCLTCREHAPDRSGRACDKPEGHKGDHWTYGGNCLIWKRSPSEAAS